MSSSLLFKNFLKNIAKSLNLTVTPVVDVLVAQQPVLSWGTVNMAQNAGTVVFTAPEDLMLYVLSIDNQAGGTGSYTKLYAVPLPVVSGKVLTLLQQATAVYLTFRNDVGLFVPKGTVFYGIESNVGSGNAYVSVYYKVVG